MHIARDEVWLLIELFLPFEGDNGVVGVALLGNLLVIIVNGGDRGSLFSFAKSATPKNTLCK
jgi:hypothetical protein